MEKTCVDVVVKPWGMDNLRPWNDARTNDGPVGELWFRRGDQAAPTPALLLKLLFANEPLSIQVHPDDAAAQLLGLAHGKTEAWYILAAAADAKVALGLKHQLTGPQLRAAIESGAIAELIDWRRVTKDDAVAVPAGTIHAIGPGLVIAEIQQRSDVTFRLFDFGRQRPLHLNEAVASAFAGPSLRQTPPAPLSPTRTLLVANAYFVLERIDLHPDSHWTLEADTETWMLVVQGDARMGSIAASVEASVGEAIYLEAEATRIEVGNGGLKALVAYVGSKPSDNLLQALEETGASAAIPAHS
jgi:mannose-6-phosphate isomerase